MASTGLLCTEAERDMVWAALKPRTKHRMSPEPLFLPPPWRPRSGSNAFEMLGVSPDASPEEVKTAYIALARRYHPDINPSAEAREIFVAINQAYLYVTSRRDLTELSLKCKMVKAKADYAESLQVVKRQKIHAGIEPQLVGAPAWGELGQQLQQLGIYLMLRCPSCKWRQKCNHATRFDEVEDIHQELMAKAMAKSAAALGKGLDSLLNTFSSMAKSEEGREKRDLNRIEDCK